MCCALTHILGAKMSINSARNVYDDETLQVKETDDSCRPELIEIVPHTRDPDHSYAKEYVSGDWSAHIKQQYLADVKQEPDDVCCAIYVVFNLSQRNNFCRLVTDNISVTFSVICDVIALLNFNGNVSV